MRNPSLRGIALVAALGLLGCGGSRDPVRDLTRDLNRYPEFLLIVDDLRVEEGFFPDYFLRFKTLTASGQRVAGRDTLIYQERTTDWHEVSEDVFGRYEHYVGMVVASKGKDGRRHRCPAGPSSRISVRGKSELRVLGWRRILAVLRAVCPHA